MYPTGELNRLARRTAMLRGRIAATRLHCATAAAGVARPIDRLDRVMAQWRRISPLAKIAALPLGLLLRRSFGSRRAPGTSRLRCIFRLMAVAMSLVRIFAARR